MKKVLCLLTGAMLVMGLAISVAAFDITSPSGEYYGYADFGAADGFLGGQSVAGDGNNLYVMNGNNIDVYEVTCSDMTNVDQHPDNPAATGPVVARTLTHVSSFSTGLSIADDSATEMAIYNGQIHFMEGNTLYSYNMAGTQTSAVALTASTIGYMYYGASHMSMLAYDDVNDVLYGMNEGHRTVYRLDGTNWVDVMSFNTLAGSHPDGLEFVTNTDGTGYLYVSDMTSDYLGQAELQADGSFLETNLFEYASTGGDVEGMGYGPLGHFWITDWNSVYEVGGGDLGGYTPPPPPTVPEPSTMALLSFGLLGLAACGKKRKFKK